VHRINARAETRTREQFVSDIARKVAGKENILFRIAAAAADKPDGIVEEVVYPAAGGLEVLLDLVREFESKGPAYRQARQRSFKASYANHYRAGLIEGRFTRAAGLTSFPTWVEESSAVGMTTTAASWQTLTSPNGRSSPTARQTEAWSWKRSAAS